MESANSETRTAGHCKGSHCALLLALLVPLLAVVLIPSYHAWDLAVFRAWGKCLGQGYTIYESCLPWPANYPVLGVLASAGMWSLLDGPLAALPYSPFFLYRLFLALIDSLNVLLLFVVLFWLRIKGAAFWVLLFSLLPSTYIGGGVWGQIDGVTQFFLSLVPVCYLLSATAVRRERPQWAAAACAGLLLSGGLALLCKQQALFSLPWVCVGFVLCAGSALRKRQSVGLAFAICLVLLALYSLDQLIEIRDPRFGGSSLLRTGHLLSTQPPQYLTANGFNFFVVLGRGMSSSAALSLGELSLFGQSFSITPRDLGRALFVVACLSYFWIYWRILVCHSTRVFNEQSSHKLLAYSLYFAALIHLSMNIFLTGTHERYLYHYGWLIFPALVYLRASGPRVNILLLLVLLQLLLYGIWVYFQIGHSLDSLRPWLTARIMLYVQLVLLVLLSLTFWRASRVDNLSLGAAAAPKTLPAS